MAVALGLLMFETILLATDLGPSSSLATAMAIELAQKFQASLTVVHVFEVPAYAYSGMALAAADLLVPAQEAARLALKETVDRIRIQVPRASSVLRIGSPARELLEAASQLNADLVVVGTHGRRGVAHFVLGSVAEHVLKNARVPVLTAPVTTLDSSP